MPRISPQPPSGPLDPAALDELSQQEYGGSAALVMEVIGLYLGDTPIKLAELRQAFARRDLPAVLGAAHAVKGGSRMIGAMRLGEFCEQLERVCAAGLPDSATPLFEALMEEYERVAAALAARLHSA